MSSGPRSQSSPALSPVQPGDTVAGKYLVERILASGGMGVVVAARHTELDERVAIKFLIPEARDKKDTVERFSREARAAVRIKSEHVARVLDVGELTTGSPYIVMEFLEGEDLEDHIARFGRSAIDDAVGYILQASEAIAEAHALGIVHRDLKPGNLFLTNRADGSKYVKVLDFGISKMDPRLAKNQAQLTSATAVLGSPLYMAPEQMRSARDADSRSDLWSLGMILYELLTGKAAFDAPTVMEMMNKIQTEDPRSIRASRPEVPAELERAVMRCLARKATDRFQTLGELVDAIVPFGPPRGQISAERVHAVMTRAGVTTGRPSQPRIDSGALTLDADAFKQGAAYATPASWAQTSAKRSRRSALFWVGGLGGLGLVLVIGFAIGGIRRDGGSRDVKPAAAAAPQPSAVLTAASPTVATPAPSSPAAPPGEASTTDPVSPEATVEATASHPSGRAPRAAQSARAAKTAGSANAQPAAPNPNLFDEQK